VIWPKPNTTALDGIATSAKGRQSGGNKQQQGILLQADAQAPNTGK